MNAPKVGDRVRVVVEGPVVRVHDEMFYVGECIDDRSGQWIYPTRRGVSVEILPPPEPEWKPGDVVRDARGRFFERANPDGWWRPGYSLVDLDNFPMRPLTRLVPEGQS